MSEVTAAACALDFGTQTVGVGYALYGAGDLLIEARPTATGVKLVIGTIEFGIAAATDVRSLLEKIIVRAGERMFRSLVCDDVLLFGSQFVPWHGPLGKNACARINRQRRNFKK